MAEKLVITFNAAVTEKYLEMAADKTRSEVDADCCPSGVSIKIDIGGPWGSTAYFMRGKETIKLGDVDVEFVDR